MAEPAPELTSQTPTLLTIEASWLGPTPSMGIPSKGQDENAIVRTLMNQRLFDKLSVEVQVPYVLCDPQFRILCLFGVTKTGQERRYYDLVRLHGSCSPDDDTAEQYDVRYVELIVERTESKRLNSPACHSQDAKVWTAHRDRLRDECRNWCASEVISYLNRYAGVIVDTKSCIVMKTCSSPSCAPELKFQDRASFLMCPSVILPGERSPATQMWLQHVRRRTYHGVGFGEHVHPEALNLWRGLQPIPPGTLSEDALPFFEHVWEVLCCKDDDLFVYVVSLFAHYVQRPLVKTDVCLVLRGRQGCGKGYVIDGMLGPLFGEHYTNVRVEQLERFNGVLAKTLLLFFDETVPAWDKKLASKLKGIITAPTHAIEEKYAPIRVLPNRINLVIATNYTCGLVEHDDRRYLVPDLSGHRCVRSEENKAYWARMWAVPPAAVHKALLETDVSDFDPRSIPVTRASKEEKELGLESPARWWCELLKDGTAQVLHVPDAYKSDVYALYVRELKECDAERRPYSQPRFWRVMRAVMGPCYVEERPREIGERQRSLKMSSLAEYRVAFCEYVRDESFFE